MNVSLPERTENAIQALIQQGTYPTPEKVIEAGIQALQQREAANSSSHIDPERIRRREVGYHLHTIEENPLDEKDKAMFEMFDRKGWTEEQRLNYIKQSIADDSLFQR